MIENATKVYYKEKYHNMRPTAFFVSLSNKALVVGTDTGTGFIYSMKVW